MASAVATLAPQAVTHMDNPPTVPVTINKIPEEDTKSQPVVPSRSRKRGASSDAIREENKKTRGRPRVEPKDETAADRRRTQIRLAQRTYRARKESTISSLEDKVEGLESNIRNVNAGVHDLYQLAITANIHSSNPLFFEALSKLSQSTTTPSTSNGREVLDTMYAPPENGYVYDSSSFSGSERQHHSPPPPAHLSHESSFEDVAIPVSNGIPTSAPGSMTVSTSAPMTHTAPTKAMPSVWGYEFYYDAPQHSAPNAAPYGFPAFSDQYATSAAYGPLQQQQHPVQQSQTQQMQRQIAPHPGAALKRELSLPQTYAFHERSFSRYFHRKCLEYALTILNEPARYQPTINYVFESTFQHSTQEAVRLRMVKRLKHNRDEDLDAEIPYESPPDVDANGHWLRPNEIEKYFSSKGLEVKPGVDTVDCETEDDCASPGMAMTSQVPAPHLQHSARASNGQIMVANPASYGSMPGFYGQMPLQQQWGQQYPNSAVWATSKRRRITIDVASLMQALVAASRCRGRTPAVRQQDLDSAFNRSIINAVPVC